MTYDLSQYLKSKYIEQYKSLRMGHNEISTEKRVTLRVEKYIKGCKDAQQESRMAHRNISPLTPIKDQIPQKETQKQSRLALLNAWKAKKAKHEEMSKRQSKKPLFVVSHSTGFPSLNSFAPRNHTFKAPVAVQSVPNFKYDNASSTRSTTKLQTNSLRPTTRSQTTSLRPQKAVVAASTMSSETSKHKSIKPIKENASSSRVNSKKVTNTAKENIRPNIKSAIKTTTTSTAKPKRLKKMPVKVAKVVEAETLRNINTSPKREKSPSIPQNCNTTPPNSPSNICRTPEPGCSQDPPVYVSPFVTVSRGKSSARKEFKKRVSTGGTFDASPDLEKMTGPIAAANYFRKMLADQILQLDAICNEWTNFKETEQIPDGAEDMINVAIGQTQLLINKKFKQFQNLIDNCEHQNGERPVTNADLHGFWDILILQVDNINTRFSNLNTLRANDWQEILPEKVKKAVQKKKPVVKKNKVEGTSSLRDAIRAAKLRAKQETEIEKSDSAMVTEVICTSSGTFLSTSNKKPKRKSERNLLTHVLSASTKRLSSPGLAIMNATMSAKNFEEEIKQNSFSQTPRSILRSTKSTASKSKSVLFMGDDDSSDGSASSVGRLTRSRLFKN